MKISDENWEIVKYSIDGVDREHITDFEAKYLNDLAERKKKEKLDEENNEESFKKMLKRMSEDELRRAYVPDVYQKDIYDIDYKKLWDKGIRLLSYDIDDTIDGVALNYGIKQIPFVDFWMPEEAVKLFKRLKKMGFIITLISNGLPEVVEKTYIVLGADNYIARAKKPATDSFKIIMQKYRFKPSQMAHIGNDIHDDVGGGNKAGITTCLVRREGMFMKVWKGVMRLGFQKTRGRRIRKALRKYGIWHKHHRVEHHDQYYQIGEVQKYSPNFRKVSFK